jgi:hypothetical protein
MLQMAGAYSRTYKFRVDIHSVRIGNRLANDMPLEELHKEAKKLSVPRIRPEQGKQDVILRIGVWQLEQIEQAEAGA